MKVLDAAAKVLSERGPMHYRDLAKRILDDGLVDTRGKTFPQTLSAALARDASREHPTVQRVAPGVYAAKIPGLKR